MEHKAQIKPYLKATSRSKEGRKIKGKPKLLELAIDILNELGLEKPNEEFYSIFRKKLIEYDLNEDLINSIVIYIQNFFIFCKKQEVNPQMKQDKSIPSPNEETQNYELNAEQQEALTNAPKPEHEEIVSVPAENSLQDTLFHEDLQQPELDNATDASNPPEPESEQLNEPVEVENESDTPDTQVVASSSEGTEARNMAGDKETQPPKKKAGRPRKDENGEKSENRMSLYFTDSEYERLRILANIAEMAAKEFVEALIKREIKKYSDDIDARQQRDKQIKTELGI